MSGSVRPDDDRVRQLRQQRGWSQLELAERAGVSLKTVENAEAGRKVRPYSLKQIAAALGIGEDAGPLIVWTASDSDTVVRPTVTSLPRHPGPVVGRDRDLTELKERLVREPENAPCRVVVSGWPGVGKTTLAGVLAHDDQLQAVFRDGVLWTSLGNRPDIGEKLRIWAAAFDSSIDWYRQSTEQVSSFLATQLHNARSLLIVDDVWEAADGQALLLGGLRCSALITTRLPSLAEELTTGGNDTYELGVLSSADALRLLESVVPDVVAVHREDAAALVTALEGLPLAIVVAGRLLRSEWRRWQSDEVSAIRKLLADLSDGAGLLRENAPANMISILNQTTPTVAALLQKSTDCLTPEILDRFIYVCGMAPKPAIFHVEDLPLLWEVSNEESKATLDSLLDHGLIERTQEDGRLWIHMLVASHGLSLCDEE